MSSSDKERSLLSIKVLYREAYPAVEQTSRPNPFFARGRVGFLWSRHLFWRNWVLMLLICGAPIWTTWEVLHLWAAANGTIRLINFAESPETQFTSGTAPSLGGDST